MLSIEDISVQFFRKNRKHPLISKPILLAKLQIQENRFAGLGATLLTKWKKVTRTRTRKTRTIFGNVFFRKSIFSMNDED